MRFYAQTPARRNRQVLVDLIAVALIAVAVWAALVVRDTIMLLAEPGRRVESSGDRLAEGLGNAGEAASGVPLIGGVLKKPLESAADMRRRNRRRGGVAPGDRHPGRRRRHDRPHRHPGVLRPSAVAAAAPPLDPAQQHPAAKLAEAPGGADLLALRALTGPPRALAKLPVPPGGWADAWRQGDREAIADLSAVALKHIGLRP